MYQGYQNQPHRVDLAHCQMCHEREARLVEPQNPEKEMVNAISACIQRVYTCIYMVYTWYIPCISKAYGNVIHMCGIYQLK